MELNYIQKTNIDRIEKELGSPVSRWAKILVEKGLCSGEDWEDLWKSSCAAEYKDFNQKMNEETFGSVA